MLRRELARGLVPAAAINAVGLADRVIRPLAVLQLGVDRSEEV
jgi:hypothetical protein